MASTIKGAISAAINKGCNAALSQAISGAIANIKECEIGKNENGKFVPTGTFYMVGVRVFDTIDEAKIFATNKATKKFFDEQALLVEKREAAAKQAADQKAANMAKYAARYQKRK